MGWNLTLKVELDYIVVLKKDFEMLSTFGSMYYSGIMGISF